MSLIFLLSPAPFLNSNIEEDLALFKGLVTTLESGQSFKSSDIRTQILGTKDTRIRPINSLLSYSVGQAKRQKSRWLTKENRVLLNGVLVN